MKNRIKYLILWAFALVISMPKGMAQGYKELPEPERTRVYNPDEGFTNVTLFRIPVFGKRNAKYIVRNVKITLNPSSFSQRIVNMRVGMYYSNNDTTIYYDPDVKLDQAGIAFITTNFPVFEPVTEFSITCGINTTNLIDGEKLSVTVELDISKDGCASEYYYPEPQYLVYKKQVSTSVQEVSGQNISVYPNPFVNELTINLPKEEIVTITNSIGQTVFSGNSNSIETSLFPIGMYFVQTSYGICKVVKYNN